MLQTQPQEDQVISGLGKVSSKAPRQAGSLLHAGRGCPMMIREDYNKAANCQILVAKGEGEADWERITVAQVDALDQDSCKPSFLPPRMTAQPHADCPPPCFIPCTRWGKHVRMGRSPPGLTACTSPLLHSLKHSQSLRTLVISK